MRFFSALFILVALAAPGCLAQKSTTPTLTSLRNQSSEQLTKCLDQPKLCGRTDIWEISDELVRRLPMTPTQTLVSCFGNWQICGVSEGLATGWPISDELARRGRIHQLLVEYWRESLPAIRGGIEHVAYHFDTPEVTTFMSKVVARQIDDGEDLYYPVNYLAKKCDPNALKALASGRYRNQGCLQYATSVQLFGKCKYRPAVPYLVEVGLNDICGNVVESAEDSLHTIYPNTPKEFKSLDSMQKFYCALARENGFSVDCK